MENILFVDKPKGISSFDVIRILRKKLGIKKAGHAGTLDPAASGLLIVGIGEGTKKLKDFVKLPKTYLAQVFFGKKTTTGDLEGEVVEEREISELDIGELKKVLKSMTGEVTLSVPIYSAVKVKGKPLYKYARRGVEVKPPKRKNQIFSAKLLGIKEIRHNDKNFVTAEIELKVSSGTYVRVVAEEIGRRLRYPATLSGLRRTKIGNLNIEKAHKLEDF